MNFLTETIAWVHQTGYSTWLRESESTFAYPFALVLHSVGMGILIGLSIVVALVILGAAGPVSVAALKGFFPFMWTGAAINGASGLVLLIANPEFMENWDFLLKLAFIALGLATMRLLYIHLSNNPRPDKMPVWLTDKVLAWASIVFWTGSIITGRMTAYIGGAGAVLG